MIIRVRGFAELLNTRDSLLVEETCGSGQVSKLWTAHQRNGWQLLGSTWRQL